MTGRRPGVSGTRELILSSARRQFAQRGYDRTSMRSVAGEAGVDPALIRHFFGSKIGLFSEAAGLSDDLRDRVREAFSGGREDVGERVARLVLGELEDPDGRARLISVVRAAASEPEAARRLREDFGSGHPEVIASISEDTGHLGAALVSTTVLGLVFARCVVGLEPLTSASSEDLVATLAPVFQQLLAPIA